MRKVFCRRWQTRGCAVEVRRSPRAIPCMPSATTGSVWTASTIVLSLGKPVDAHAACCGHICALRVTAAPQLQSHPEEMSEEHRTFDLRRAFCIGSSHAQAPLGSSHAPHARTDGVASCASAVFFSKTRPGALFSRAKPSRVYYDTARSGAVGGKANTCPRNQTGHWRGYNLLAGKKGSKRGLRPGEEIFVPYGREYNLHVGGNGIDDARQGWGFTRRRRQSGGGRREEEQTAVLVPTPQPGATPAPLRGGEGGNLLYRGVRAFQHALGVSAPT
jgi:hypothetical protein